MATRVSYRLVSDWGSGFNAGVAIAAGETGLDGWTLEFDASFQITQIWNAEIVSHVGSRYVIRNAAWNGLVGPGGTAEFGFLGGPAEDKTPGLFLLNGQVASGDVAPPPPLPLPSLAVADAVVTEGDAGAQALTFTVSLSAAATGPVTVAYAARAGTATAGADFTALAGTLAFAAGETSRSITVEIAGDALAEGDETLALVLSSPSGATLADAEATGTIRDDDAATPPPAGDTVRYRVANDWGSGFLGEVTVVNDATAMTGWTVEFDASFEITSIWNAVVASHSGTHYVIRNADWNGGLGPEASAGFGFQASGIGSVTGLVLNGVPVGGGGGGTTAPPLPSLSVANLVVTEGDSGTGTAAFTVSLSAAATAPVTVRFATADGTALAGSDYDALSGTLTFAPGETSKVVGIAIRGDTVREAGDAFQLRLESADGATIARGAATATILDDDAATSPPPSGGAGTIEGFFSTRGNQIVDASGDVVRIAGVNWFGLETGSFAPHGLHARNWQDMMDQMAELGFNTIRLPFSLELLQGRVPSGMDTARNPDLAGLDGLQIMDRVVEYAGQIGLRIILDNHRSAAGAGPNANGLWHDGGYTEADWVEAWTSLAARYAGNPTVIGADLSNEPHNGTWGGGGPGDWTRAAERAGNAIHAANGDWLIFVEGVGSYRDDHYWWGGQLAGVRDDPVRLETPNKLVYSPHDYGNSIYGQPWFSEPGFPDNLAAEFDEHWGYIYREGIAPVMLGEFGTRLQDPKDALWLGKLLAYLGGDLDVSGTRDIPAGDLGMGWTWWSWNPNSGDTGGILQDDWTTPVAAKLEVLRSQMFEFA